MELGLEKAGNLPGVTRHVTSPICSRTLNSAFVTDAQHPSPHSLQTYSAHPCSPRMREGPYFLWTSVRVMPCSVTLKWTTVGVGRTSLSKTVEMAFCTAKTPVRVSTLTELRYKVWQPVGCRYCPEPAARVLGEGGGISRPRASLCPEPGEGDFFFRILVGFPLELATR